MTLTALCRYTVPCKQHSPFQAAPPRTCAHEQEYELVRRLMSAGHEAVAEVGLQVLIANGIWWPHIAQAYGSQV